VVFEGVHLDDAEHVALSRVLGECEMHPIEEIRSQETPELIVLRAEGVGTDHPGSNDVVGSIPWHSDLTYTATPPRAAVLRALVVPPTGGETAFVNTATVFRELPAPLKAASTGRYVRHSFEKHAGTQVKDAVDSGAVPFAEVPRFDSVVHPLVTSHPVSGAPVLNISPEFVDGVIGMDKGLGDELLEGLIAFATQERFVYRHEWSEGDVVIWDNSQTIHAALGHQRRYGRLMMRTTVAGRQLAAFAG
jgi:taurine dioxygenase